MNKFTSIEPGSLYFSNCNLAYLLDTSQFHRVGARGGERVCTLANILIVMTVAPGDLPLSMTRWDFIDVLTLPPFRRAADYRINRTVKIGYDVCSARYRECSRQPIRVILRESPYVKSWYPTERRPHSCLIFLAKLWSWTIRKLLPSPLSAPSLYRSTFTASF